MLECPGLFFRGSAGLLCLVSGTTLKPVPGAWRSGPVAPRIADICTKVGCAEKATSEARVVDGKLVAGSKELTREFRPLTYIYLPAAMVAVCAPQPQAASRVKRAKYTGEGRESAGARAGRLDTQIEPRGGAF